MPAYTGMHATGRRLHTRGVCDESSVAVPNVMPKLPECPSMRLRSFFSAIAHPFCLPVPPDLTLPFFLCKWGSCLEWRPEGKGHRQSIADNRRTRALAPGSSSGCQRAHSFSNAATWLISLAHMDGRISTSPSTRPRLLSIQDGGFQTDRRRCDLRRQEGARAQACF